MRSREENSRAEQNGVQKQMIETELQQGLDESGDEWMAEQKSLA
jgi:hypothetical protein